jgi:protein TonB
MLAVLMALLFAASAWFFYHQGQRDALGAASPPVSATNEAATHGSASLATNGSDPDSATPVAQTASNSEPDIIVTVHPKPEQMRAPAAKPKARLAKATKPAKSAPVVAKIDRQVVLATRPQPVYPAQALRTREQGTVLVLAQVDVNGHVSDARVVRRSGYSILDRAASNEVRRWTFSPALHDGQPIVASVQVPVSYRLDQ